MQHQLFFCAAFFCVIFSAHASEHTLRFASDPSLSPDAETIVFSYENDLWTIHVSGGTASRITAMDGREFLPRFSPDGRWIAFSGTLDGNTNVFVVPAAGGEIRQLTFHQSADLVDSWSWDSQNIYFHASRYNMTTHALDKEALILDIRFNRGGNVHDDVLQFLSQRPYLKWKYRGGRLAPQPNFSPSGNPMALLINERSLSDAEMTAEGFRRLELGPIVGTETYRWIIFTSGKQMVDGSFCRLPAWGCYTLDGHNLEFTGVSPDIPVHNTFEDRLLGRDPQLDRAIQEVLK